MTIKKLKEMAESFKTAYDAQDWEVASKIEYEMMKQTLLSIDAGTCSSPGYCIFTMKEIFNLNYPRY